MTDECEFLMTLVIVINEKNAFSEINFNFKEESKGVKREKQNECVWVSKSLCVSVSEGKACVEKARC